MKKKRQNKKEIDDYNKHLMEYWLQLWAFGTISDLYDDFEEQLTQNERMMRYIFGESVC